MFSISRSFVKGMALLDLLSPEELCASLPIGPDYSMGFRVEYVGELSSPERGIMCLPNDKGFSAFLTAPADFYGSYDYESEFNALVVNMELSTMEVIEHARELIPV